MILLIFSQISIFKKILRIKYISLYMANIKVVDINEADVKLANSSHELCDKQEETTAIEDIKAIEEAKPEEEVVNEVVEQTNEEVNEEVNEDKPKPKTKPKPSDIVDCNNCGKSMSYKNYRYRHEKLCTAEPKPVKAQAKPKAKVKMMPHPKFKQVEVYEVEEPKPAIKQQIPQQQSQPTNPLMDITNHYQLLQNQFIQQKKEKYNNLCQNMFTTKSKKR